MRRSSFGPIRKLPSGRWQASYWREGTRYAAPEVFAAKADATSYLASVQTDLKRGVWTDPEAGARPFGPYAEQWIANRLVKGRPPHASHPPGLPSAPSP